MAKRERRLRLVIPVVTKDFRDREELRLLGSPGTEISVVSIERGPVSIETAFDTALATPDTIRRIVEAEREGMDAVVIDCMDDPGMEAGRELVSIPVVGPSQASMHLAAILGHRFSIVTILDERSVAPFENQAKVYGVSEKLASVRWVEIPVLELHQDPERLVHDLVQESAAAIEQDQAHVIIFGCTGMLGYAEQVRLGLEQLGHGGVPVIDPVPAAVRLAEVFVDLCLSQSKRSYPVPPVKPIVGFDVLGGKPTPG
jgi:allantoin racemase